MERIQVPVLHAIAGPEELETPEFARLATDLLERLGPDLAVHLRAPRSPVARLSKLAATLSEVAASAGGWCVVNGRPDVALVAGAQGVQVGRRAIPLAETLRLVAGRAAVGASVHGVEDAVGAARLGANWLLLGTIYRTPSHPGRPGSGPRAIADTIEALATSGLEDPPVVAIGGIDAERVAEVRMAGAGGVAVRRAIWSAADPIRAAQRLSTGAGA